MSTPSLAATADGMQGHKNYSLAFNVYALVAATANGELENKNICLLAMSAPSLAVTAIQLAV